jgi:hypothetical protein
VTSHEIAKLLLSLPDTDLEINIDVSTGDNDQDNRAYGLIFRDEWIEDPDTITLLFDGEVNF